MYRSLRFPFSRNRTTSLSFLSTKPISNLPIYNASTTTIPYNSYYTDSSTRPKTVEESEQEEKIYYVSSSTNFRSRKINPHLGGAQAHIIPHPEKAGNCEDAYFISKGGNIFGVADGVGVWSELGINSGLYSTSLLNHVKEFVEREDNEDCSLYEALLYAYTKV